MLEALGYVIDTAQLKMLHPEIKIKTSSLIQQYKRLTVAAMFDCHYFL